MRVAASLLAVMAASLVSAQAVHAQTADKARQATAASSKTQGIQKTTGTQAQARPATAAATNAGKAKLEGVSTMRSTPADGKKAGGGCHYGDASDA